MKIYLDMDGVVADFDGFLHEYQTAEKKDHDADHQTLFRTLVTEEKIFENLSTMEGAHDFIYKVREMVDGKGVEIFFLTSVGTKDPDLGTIVSDQKVRWLRQQGFPFKPLFVTEKKHKAKYAHDKAILIDDRPGCVEPFRAAGGRAILHKYVEETLQALEEHVEIITKW